MRIELPYGESCLQAVLPESCAVEFIVPKAQPTSEDPDALVRDAVYNPLGAVKPPRAGQTVAIAINDKTRPVPHRASAAACPDRACATLAYALKMCFSSSRPARIRGCFHPNTAPVLPAEILENFPRRLS